MTLNTLLIKLQHIKQTKEGAVGGAVKIVDQQGNEYTIKDVEWKEDVKVTIIKLNE